MARVRLLLNSGFVLPQKNIEGADEVTSPIWIFFRPLHFQVQTGVEGTILSCRSLLHNVRMRRTKEDLAPTHKPRSVPPPEGK